MSVEKALKNTAFGLLSQAVLLVFGFISQRVVNLYMGAELVGMNGVISNIIAVISVTELGLSTAIGYHLYGALVRQDEVRIAALMEFYRRAYYLMGAVIGTLGLLLLPWVHLFMKQGSYSVGYVRALYLLWLVRAVMAYLLTYKRTLLIADERGYLISGATILLNILNYSIITAVVAGTGRYLPALALNIVVEAALDIAVNRRIDRRYPFLHKAQAAPVREMLPVLKKDIKNTFAAKASTNLLQCTDNLIISGFVSVTAVGLYNNYALITRSIGNILTELAGAVQPGVGHLLVRGDHEDDFRVLRQLTFVFFCIVTAAACGMSCLMDPFITDLWLDGSFRLEKNAALLCIAAAVVQGLGLPIGIMTGASGLFEQEKRLAVLSAIVNLVVSLALVLPEGVAGVLWGTVLSYALQLGYRVFVFFAEYLHRPAGRYLLDLLEYALLLLGEVWLTEQAVGRVYRADVSTFMLSALVCVALPTGLNLLLFSPSWRLKSMAGILWRQLRK